MLRADDLLPVLKLYSDKGTYFDLPPDFLEVMDWELSKELEALDTRLKKENDFSTKFKNVWNTFLNFQKENPRPEGPEAAAAFETIGPLLSTTWNQNSPYNYYAPAASGGPGGRAYAGCVATAVSQVLRYHKYPTNGVGTYIYTDNIGSCQGTHTATFSTANYDWANMPVELFITSSDTEIKAVAKLIYHCGVGVRMDFEGSASGAYSESVPDMLRDYLKYDCADVAQRPGTSKNAQWYARIENDMKQNRPAYYSFTQTAGGAGGHAVVLDGCRNGNQIHLNFGWGGGYGNGTAWYNMDNISHAGGFNYNHKAVFGICPTGELDDKYEPNDIKENSFDLTYYEQEWLSSISNSGVQVNEDWYKITLDNAPVFLMITCCFQNASGNIELDLYNESSVVDFSHTTNNGEYIEYSVSAPGTYYLRVDSNNVGGYPYVKEYWLNDYDLKYSIPEGSSAIILLLMGLFGRKMKNEEI